MNDPSAGSDVKTTPVRVLIVENNPDDAELMTQLLEADGLNFTANRAETELEFIAGLESGVDVILCDHTLPTFSASRALELVRDRNALVPLLIVSGTISEGLAVEFMRRGACDYLLKDDLERLGPAVRNALDRFAAEARPSPAALELDGTLFRQLFDQHPDAVWTCDPTTQKFLQANATAVSRYGYSRGEFLSMHLGDLLSAGQSPPGIGQANVRHRLRNGGEIEVETSTSLVEQAGVQFLLVLARDNTERRIVEDRLRHGAQHDPLTSLANRSLLLDRMGQALARRRTGGPSCALVLLDLDHFKEVNDSAGHAGGDRVLKEVARRLASTVRAGDTACRLGGDEFAVLLDNPVSAAGAIRMAERIALTLHSPIVLESRTYEIGGSIGIALADGQIRGGEELLRNADEAMYAAKRSGRGTIRLFHGGSSNAASAANVDLQHELRDAIESHRLALVFQPQVEAQSGALVAVEALVQWPHPELGLLDADEIILLAERCGLTMAVDHWVLRTAALLMREHDETRPSDLRLVVRNSLTDFRLADLIPCVQEALAESGLKPKRLEIEVAMRSVGERAEAVAVLTEIAALGVRIALCDVGAGPLILNQLEALPLRSVKIDRALGVRAVAKGRAAAVVKGLVAIGEGLGLTTVVDGVETKHQLKVMTALGCELVQGNLISKPLPLAEIDGIVAGNGRVPNIS